VADLCAPVGRIGALHGSMHVNWIFSGFPRHRDNREVPLLRTDLRADVQVERRQTPPTSPWSLRPVGKVIPDHPPPANAEQRADHAMRVRVHLRPRCGERGDQIPARRR